MASSQILARFELFFDIISGKWRRLIFPPRIPDIHHRNWERYKNFACFSNDYLLFNLGLKMPILADLCEGSLDPTARQKPENFSGTRKKIANFEKSLN